MSWRTRSARAFADAIDGRAKPSSREVASLIAVAEQLCAAAAEPSPEFRTGLRTSLMTEAAAVLTAAPPTATARARLRQFPAATRRRAAIVVAVLAATLGFAGMTTASASALPGDSLYPVKRGIENTQLALNRGDSKRGMFRLELAGERLQETSALTERRSTPSSLEAGTLAEYSTQARLGSDALVRSYKADNHRADIVAINRFATRSAGEIAKLEGRLEGAAAEALEAVQTQLAAIVETSARTCPACGGIDPDLISELTGAGPSAESSAPPVAPNEAAPEALPGPGPAPGGRNPASSHSPSNDEDAESDEEVSSDSDENSDSDAPSPAPSPRQSPSPGPSPSPSPTPAAPTADFTWSGNPGVGNELRVDFTDASSADATAWKWDFGDGSPTSQVKNPPRHTYPAAGTYAVTLTVTNAGGGTNSVTKNVTVPVTERS